MSDQVAQCCREIDSTFDNIFGHGDTGDDAPEFLLRTASKSIVTIYPDNDARARAIAKIIDAAWDLKRAEGA